jgi:hypothetical protein
MEQWMNMEPWKLPLEPWRFALEPWRLILKPWRFTLEPVGNIQPLLASKAPF